MALEAERSTPETAESNAPSRRTMAHSFAALLRERPARYLVRPLPCAVAYLLAAKFSHILASPLASEFAKGLDRRPRIERGIVLTTLSGPNIRIRMGKDKV